MLNFLLSRQHFLRLIGTAGLAAALPRISFASEVAGKASRIKGTVSVSRGGNQGQLNEGDEVLAGDVVTTLAESRARLALADGSQINLGELTRITIAEFSFQRETLTREAAIDLQSGLLQAITAKAGAGSSFVVRTNNAVAATRSTEWIVEAKKAETIILVQEGKVDVQESALGFRSLPSAEQDKAILLSAGQFTVVGKMKAAGLGPQMTDGARLEKYLAGLAMD